MIHNCPTCGSDLTQSFKMAYMNGVSIQSSTFSGNNSNVEFFSGGNYGIGIGKISGYTTGISLSNLAQLTQPPAQTNTHAYPILFKIWSHQWLCNQCGQTFFNVPYSSYQQLISDLNVAKSLDKAEEDRNQKILEENRQFRDFCRKEDSLLLKKMCVVAFKIIIIITVICLFCQYVIRPAVNYRQKIIQEQYYSTFIPIDFIPNGAKIDAENVSYEVEPRYHSDAVNTKLRRGQEMVDSNGCKITIEQFFIRNGNYGILTKVDHAQDGGSIGLKSFLYYVEYDPSIKDLIISSESDFISKCKEEYFSTKNYDPIKLDAPFFNFPYRIKRIQNN